MTRASGILVGALLMLAVFLLTLSAGISPPPLQSVVSSAADTPSRVIGPLPAEDAAVKDAADSVVPPAAEPASLDDVPQLDVSGDSLEVNPQSWNRSMESHATAYRKEATQVSRYLVWSPFRSKWAAQGFARRLTLATGVPVTVISEGAENYQVVFSYRDDGERQALVTQIETVTGLELE
jgi:hypothetical protein